MHRTILDYNLVDPFSDIASLLGQVSLRGYDESTFLTGKFANLVHSRKLKPLTVDNIAHFYCETRRDLYQLKGVNPRFRRSPSTTWGKVAGTFVETYLIGLSQFQSKSRDIDFRRVKKRAASLTAKFRRRNRSQVKKLWAHRSESSIDPNRLIRSLELNARAEIFALLSSRLCRQFSIRPQDIKFRQALNPHPEQIGINSPSTPDFMIPKSRVVGDIKTGPSFQDAFLLTCTGYALAYENQRKNNDADLGILYFFRTKGHSDYARPISFGQPYIFAIDDAMRSYFIDLRDRAYETVSKDSPPPFPADKQKCHSCPFLSGCRKDGLQP